MIETNRVWVQTTSTALAQIRYYYTKDTFIRTVDRKYKQYEGRRNDKKIEEL